MQEVLLASDTIKLGQLLKLACLVESGADAKLMLASGKVRVNGQVEERRGRQLARGDEVSVEPGASPSGTEASVRLR